MTAGASETAERFEAVLYPNPPLSDRGFLLFVVATAFVAVVMAALFVSAGAWPVGAFFGLDLLLLYLAFWSVRRGARRREWIRVDRRDVRVGRVGPGGEFAEWRFEPCWLRVHFDEPPRPDSLVVLSSHGRSLRLGSFLTPDERREFARQLRAALDRVRHPVP